MQQVMARALTVHKRLKLLGLGIVFSILTFLPGVALASNYGSGDYGACNFEDGCAASSVSTSDTEVVELEPDITEIVLNSYDAFFVDAGITVTNLKVGDVLSFCLTSNSCVEAKNDFHTITIKALDLSDPENPIITLTFASSPFDVTFSKGDIKKIDVDQDGADDIEVTFVAVVDGHAILSTKNLSNISSDVSSTEDAAVSESNKTWFWVGVVVLAIVVLLVIIRLI